MWVPVVRHVMMTSEPNANKTNQMARDPLADTAVEASRRETGVIAIWDIWTRLFHWSLAFTVLFLFVSGKTGFQFYDWHRTAGEFVLMLLVFRFLWGLIGSSNVRLSALFQNPLKGLSHLGDLFKRKVDDERGHNAAGSWAVLILMSLLLVQALTGLFIADEDELIEGAFYGQFGSDVSYFLYDVHQTNAQLLMVLVGIHVAMVFVYLLVAGKNLITPMFSGRMRWTSNSAVPTVNFQHWWIGVLCLIVAVVGIGWLLEWSV